MAESVVKSYSRETKPVIQRLARNIHRGAKMLSKDIQNFFNIISFQQLLSLPSAPELSCSTYQGAFPSSDKGNRQLGFEDAGKEKSSPRIGGRKPYNSAANIS